MSGRQGMTRREVLLLLLVASLVLLLVSVCLPVSRSTGHKSRASSKLANIAKAYANFRNSGGGSRQVTHAAWSLTANTSANGISDYAAVLAYAEDLNDAQLWYIDMDPANEGATFPERVLVGAGDTRTINPVFATECPGNGYHAWAAYVPVPVDITDVTPLAWTRGLRHDGTWDARKGVWGAEGGHVAFGDGHVCWFYDAKEEAQMFVSRRKPGTLTPDWAEAVSADGDVQELSSAY